MRRPTRILVFVGIALVVLVGGAAIAVNVLLSGDRVRAALEAQATVALGHPVRIGGATPRFFPRVSLDLTEIVIGDAREVTIGTVRLSTGLRGLVRRRVEDARVSVERSTIDVRWALALLSALSAPSDGAGDAETPASSALTIDSIGEIAVRDVTLIAGPRKLLVDMDSSLIGDRFLLRRSSAASDVSNFIASGEITSIAKQTGAFTIEAESIDLDGLLAFLVAATPAEAIQTGKATAPRPHAPAARSRQETAVVHAIDVSVRAKKGLAVGIALSELTTTAKLRGSDVRLDDLQVHLFGGQFSGAAAFSNPTGRQGRYEWRGSFQGLDVPQLVAFAGAPGSITGRLAGTVALAAAGTDPPDAIRRARGSAKLTISDGRVPGLEIVRSVILAFGKPTGDRPAGSGEAFTRLAATLAVSGLETTTDDLTFESRDFDMRGKGRVSLANQAIAFQTDVILSSELSAQAGRDLFRLAREGDRIVLPARISGSASAPTVFIDVQSALGRALRNRVQDEVKGLFERLRKKRLD
jgi:hypothetical protein